MKTFKAWAPVVVWMSVIFYLSHQPAQQSSELSTGITMVIVNLIHNLLPIFEIDYTGLTFFIRKLAHLVAYLILGYFMIRALSKNKHMSFKTILIAFLICVIFAISDEVHQLFVPGRSGEVRDVMIDSIGAVLGIVMYLLQLKILLKD